MSVSTTEYFYIEHYDCSSEYDFLSRYETHRMLLYLSNVSFAKQQAWICYIRSRAALKYVILYNLQLSMPVFLGRNVVALDQLVPTLSHTRKQTLDPK